MSETNKDYISYIAFENHKIPEFKEVKNTEYIYFGEDNLYPDYLIELYLRCAKHNAIINSKTGYIYGGGLAVDDKTSTIVQKAITEQFIEKLVDFLPETIKDFELFNSVAIEIIYNKTGTDIADFVYMPMSKIRTNADESMYFYSNDWSKKRQDPEKTGYKELKPFDFKNKVKGSQLAVFKLKSPKNGVDKNVYGIPNYIGATSSIETDIEISNFHLNNIKSGFSMGTIINFNDGVPTEEGKTKIERQIKKKSTGTDKAGGLVITFNKSADNAPTITSFTPNELDKQFIEIGKRVDQEIFTAHNIISPVLFGVTTPGSLGQKNEMLTAYELFQNTYVNSRQLFLEQIINGFASYFGIINHISFKKASPLKSVIPDSIVEKAYNLLDNDQLLDLVGLPKKKTFAPVQMKAEKKKIDINWFKGLGTKASDYEILFERSFKGQSDEDCINEFSKQTFADELTANEKAVVDLLGKDPLTPSDAMAKVLKISVKEVNDLIDSLVERKYLTSGSEPTSKGEKASEGAKTEVIEVKYKYSWRSEIPSSERDTTAHPSREFCQDLMSGKTGDDVDPSNPSGPKLFSRSEIDGLNNEQGLDVWESRGGWWNDDGIILAACRHEWKQVVVKKK